MILFRFDIHGKAEGETKMKTKVFGVLFIVICLGVFALSSIISAQSLDTQAEEFDNLHEELKRAFDRGDYSKVLTKLEAIRVLVHKRLDAKSSTVLSNNKDSDFDRLFRTIKSPAIFNFGLFGKKSVPWRIKVHYGENIIYVIDLDEYTASLPTGGYGLNNAFWSQLAVEFRGRLAVENKYFKVDNQTKTVKYRICALKMGLAKKRLHNQRNWCDIH